MSPIRKVFFGVVATGLVVMACGTLAYLAGLRVNTTKSIALGIYKTTQDPIGKGAYVLFCPDPKVQAFGIALRRQYITEGFCPGSYGYLMKKVLAAKGDVVDWTEQGVKVNGQLVPLSAPKDTDGAGRAMPRIREQGRTLRDRELLLMGDVSPKSFDARYYGLIDVQQIQSVIKPVWVW